MPPERGGIQILGTILKFACPHSHLETRELEHLISQPAHCLCTGTGRDKLECRQPRAGYKS